MGIDRCEFVGNDPPRTNMLKNRPTFVPAKSNCNHDRSACFAGGQFKSYADYLATQQIITSSCSMAVGNTLQITNITANGNIGVGNTRLATDFPTDVGCCLDSVSRRS
jgi:hypothetical protein